MRMNKVVLIVGILLFVVLGALLPFIRQPEVTEETKESLDLSRFYSDELSGERAKVIFPERGSAGRTDSSDQSGKKESYSVYF